METISFSFHLSSLSSRLNRTMQYGNLKNIITDDERKESLNRTMQYGNTAEPDTYFLHVLSLNRTMQYGNVLPSDSTTYTIPGLNRTMQYGNFTTWQLIRVSPTLFKSYYVVWKLVFFVILEHTSILFKSYYVVWKPAKTTKTTTTTGKSLNRTMQYGNRKYKMKNNIISGV